MKSIFRMEENRQIEIKTEEKHNNIKFPPKTAEKSDIFSNRITLRLEYLTIRAPDDSCTSVSGFL